MWLVRWSERLGLLSRGLTKLLGQACCKQYSYVWLTSCMSIYTRYIHLVVWLSAWWLAVALVVSCTGHDDACALVLRFCVLGSKEMERILVSPEPSSAGLHRWHRLGPAACPSNHICASHEPLLAGTSLPITLLLVDTDLPNKLKRSPKLTPDSVSVRISVEALLILICI